MPPHSFSEFDTPPSSSSSRHDTHEDDDSTDCSGGIAGIQLELLEMEQDDDDDNQLSSTPPLAAKKDEEEPSSSVEEDPHDPICMDLQDIDLWNADETEDMTVVPPIIPSRPLGGGGGMPHHHHLVETVVSSSSSSESESDSDDDDDDDSDDDDDDDTESEPEDDDDEENTTTTTSGGGGSTTLFRTTRPKKRKTNTSTLQPQHHVTFTDIHIREYTQVLGDHPCCSLGPPVSLGWEYRTCADVSLDYYEVTRVPRRSRRDLRLSWEDRRSILSNYSDGDCRRVQRRLNRENVSKATGSRSNGLFFRTTTTP